MPSTEDLKLEILNMISELSESKQKKVNKCVQEIRRIIKENGQAGIYAMSLIAVEYRN